MVFSVLQKQLDESTHCPLCKASMYWIEAEQYDQELSYHECSHCQHQLYSDQKHNCYCERCLAQRKRMLKEVRLQENRQYHKKQDRPVLELNQLSFINKLFLLAILDEQVQEYSQHREYIDWHQIRYYSISPNYLFQHGLVKSLIRDQVLIPKDLQQENQHYYINVRLDGYSEPTLFSITQQLRNWFYQNLGQGVPFKSADEVKDALYCLLYEEIIQFAQFYCRSWNVQIAGNQGFQTFCYRLLDVLAVGQIYYLVQTGLEYLYKQKALKPRNENFINTNLLKKTLQQYREHSVTEKWETSTLPRPPQLAFSKMSEILFYRFLGYDENIFFQPVWRSWHKIEPRLKFYSQKRCMHCGSQELSVDYDASDYVSLFCRSCKHQDHYFTR